ncbi:hypothetical protein NX779_02975 [Mycoplasma cottewii]|uniref:Uncharacterized protein n=1 Tax=Mycoplasma cottewii TaxID=51364 RepID=A0ABY5TVP5_9MOLU|nr:hypothetical protein [Mycoplasma cottewii]UWD34753.1 hypothetical protein NX779_02975 [Mycoplasma cottewii]
MLNQAFKTIKITTSAKAINASILTVSKWIIMKAIIPPSTVKIKSKGIIQIKLSPIASAISHFKKVKGYQKNKNKKVLNFVHRVQL